MLVILLFVCCSSLVCFSNNNLSYFSLYDVSCSLSLVPTNFSYACHVALFTVEFVYTSEIVFVCCFHFVVVLSISCTISDDGVTSKSALVNVRLASGSVPPQKLYV